MSDITRFKHFISNEYSIDYWSDVAIAEAAEMLQQLSRTELQSLISTWRSMSSIAQTRLAQLSGEVPNEYVTVIPMLMDMLRSDDPDLVEASIDTLNTITSGDPNVINIFDFKSAFANITTSNPICAIVFQRLQHKVNNP